MNISDQEAADAKPPILRKVYGIWTSKWSEPTEPVVCPTCKHSTSAEIDYVKDTVGDYELIAENSVYVWVVDPYQDDHHRVVDERPCKILQLEKSQVYDTQEEAQKHCRPKQIVSEFD